MRAALKEDRACLDGSASQRIQAVFLVSPTYEGVVSDVEKLRLSCMNIKLR